jgi:ribosomal protein S13
MENKSIKDTVLKNYGLNNSKFNLICKTMGLNFNRKITSINKKHLEFLNKFYKNQILNKELKNSIQTNILFKKKLKK